MKKPTKYTLCPYTTLFRSQVERERAAAAERAAQPDLAAEQLGDFAADRQTETGAAVLAAGRAIRLLEGFEDDLRSEEHTSELQSLAYLVCRLLLDKKNIYV